MSRVRAPIRMCAGEHAIGADDHVIGEFDVTFKNGGRVDGRHGGTSVSLRCAVEGVSSAIQGTLSPCLMPPLKI